MDEFDIISKYFAPLSLGAQAALGLKDDVAWLGAETMPDGVVITTDTIVETVHFRSTDPIDTIARKLVRVNCSDIIAKGCRPIGAFLNLTWPKNRNIDELKLFAQTLGQELGEVCKNAPLLGGDTSRGNNSLILSLTLLGVPIGKSPILRSGANIGDIVFVSGDIGDAKIGLEALNEDDIMEYPHSIGHYQVPNIGNQSLAQIIAHFASAAIDVSDGLLGDAKKLADCSNMGIEIEISKIPLSNEANHWLDGKVDRVQSIIDLASFGDDYQVLFCVNPSRTDELVNAAQKANVKITPVGICKSGSGIELKYGNDRIATLNQLSHVHTIG